MSQDVVFGLIQAETSKGSEKQHGKDGEQREGCEGTGNDQGSKSSETGNESKGT